MAITQAQSDKNWQDSPSTTTPILAADLKAMSKRDRSYVVMVPSSMTSIDEFDDDTLDPAWVRVDPTGMAAANATWTEGGDSLSVGQLGGDAANGVRALVRPLSGVGGALAVGDGFVTAVRILSPNANYTMGGIVLADSATTTGAQAVGLLYQGGATIVQGGWSGTNWSLGGATADTTHFGGGYLIFIRFSLVAANTWRLDTSPNGVSWNKSAFTLSKTFTPTHVGLVHSSWGSTIKSVVSYEFIRRVSGVS